MKPSHLLSSKARKSNFEPMPIPTRAYTHSLTQMTEYVLPQHANAIGSVFGGQIMAWVDLCAAIAAQRHSGKQCVTAFVDDLQFQEPVRVGEVVRLTARLNAAFRTSMEIEVIVEGEDSKTGRSWPCVKALVVFVAVDERRAPTEIAPLLLTSDDDKARAKAATERRDTRLANRPARSVS